MSPYGMDWSNVPDPFKRYPDLEPVEPPPELARLVRLGAGVHPRRGAPYFRTFMSAGALHPVELYVATTSLWHFHPGEGKLRRLREEDPRAALAEAAAAPKLAEAAAVLVLTGILWRTAWKYGERGWRHVFWDAGTMLANLLALVEEGGDDPRLLIAFVDAWVEDVLGVEPPREEPVALVAVGGGEHPDGPVRLEPIELGSPPLSRREHRFAEAEKAQAASSLATADDVRSWREAAQEFGRGTGSTAPPGELEQVIRRRGSARDFTDDAIGRDEVADILDWTCAPVPGDLAPLCSTFVVAHAVDGLDAAAYRFEPPDGFEPLGIHASRRTTAHLCLDQPLGGNAAATLFLTADLDRILPALDGRGYRAAQLDAGVRAGRASLGAYGRGLGATGLTFYDDEVRRYLGTQEEPMMCVAVGVDALRPSLRLDNT